MRGRRFLTAGSKPGPMTRSLLLALALAMLPLTASAQGLWVGPDGEGGGGGGMADGPPVLAGDLSAEADAASRIGDELDRQAEESYVKGFIKWVAETFGPNVPRDPNGGDGDDPPGGGEADPPGDEGADPPGGGGAGDPPGDTGNPPDGAPPGGSGGTPPDGGAPGGGSGGAQPDGGSGSTASSSAPTGGSGSSGTAGQFGDFPTFLTADRMGALALRDQMDRVQEGTFVPGVTLADGARVRLVSKRELNPRERSEFQLRFEIVPRGRRGQAAHALVQAGDGVVLTRVNARDLAIRAQGNRQRGEGQRARQGRRGRGNN